MTMLNSTRTTDFLVPALGITDKKLREMGFINGYLLDIVHDETYENCLYLLFIPKNSTHIGEFIEERREEVAAEYDYEGGFVVVVFKFPEKYNAEYELFLQGKYSRFGAEYKAIFTKEATEIDKSKGYQLSYAYMVIHKTKDLREIMEEIHETTFTKDMELSGLPNWDNEIITEILLENIKTLPDYAD